MSAAAAPAPSRSAGDRGGTTASRWVFAAMVLACFAAFFLTQRLKHVPTLVQHVTGPRYFSPEGRRILVAGIQFDTDRADVITVSIQTNPGGLYVDTIARGLRVPRYCPIHLGWNGATAAGRQAPAGNYQIDVRFAGAQRAVVPLHTITLVRPAGVALRPLQPPIAPVLGGPLPAGSKSSPGCPR